MIKKFIDKLLSKADSVRPRKPRFGKRVEVPASVHGIDPTLVDRRALDVVSTLQDAGYAAYIVGGAVRLGYARFNLNLADGRDAALSDLASQKHRLWDGFCMNFLQGLYVALWSLLLFIPGVVKAYSYAMTPYIMAEHPGLTANEAITESRRIMDGNKWRLFCLDLSFLGWELLCTLPMLIGFSLVFAFTRSADTVLVPLILLSIPLSVGFFFLHPYEEAAWAIFYRDITAAPSDTEEI